VRYERENKTEAYVEIPPAFLITDSAGACWTFGALREHNGEYEFSVMPMTIRYREVAKPSGTSVALSASRSYGWKGSAAAGTSSDHPERILNDA